MKQLFQSLNEIINKTTGTKKMVTVLMVLVVFVTTYILILPAFTLTQEKAEQQGGIDIPAMETAAEESSGEESDVVDSKTDDASDAESEVKAEDDNNAENEAEAVTEAQAERDATAEKEAEGKAEAVGGEGSETKVAAQADLLTFEGEGFTVAVDDAKSVLPENTEVVASELLEKPEEGTKAERKEAEEQYRKYYDLALQSINDSTKKGDVSTISFVKFYDISLQSEGEEVQPEKPVNVTISYGKDARKDMVVDRKADVHIVHFTQDENTGEIVPELLEEKDISSTLTSGNRLMETSFEAGSFSVYGVVYTVDFEYISQADGRTYTYSMEGGSEIALSVLLEKLGVVTDDKDTLVNETELFVGEIDEVTFSDPKLISITKEKNDWKLTSLKAFDTEENLKITMKGGEKFSVKVTDAQEIPDAEKATIDSGKSYLICYEVTNGGETTYYLLKNDGTVDSAYHPDFEGDTDAEHDFEHLNSTYAWSFNHIFKENDVEHHLDKNYYLIRPIDNLSMTITLNNANESLVQPGNNNVAVIQSGDGFILEGYHNIGTEEAHRYIHLGFDGNEFVGVDGDGVTVHVYEMDSLPTYDYTVRSADETRGTVTVSDGTYQDETKEGEVVAHYYDATSGHDKKNAGTITAAPVTHMNQGQNKWEFDHWELNGLPLDRNQYPATIQPNALPIPYNDSRLVAYFRQNPNYVVPPTEKEASSVEDMTGWLEGLQKREIPLIGSETKKTAEVYDYQNRIYRVDFTSKANFETFAGNIDMAFCLDVSNSMYFPSALVETTSATRANPMPIYQINNSGWWYDNRNWLDTSRGWNNPYYLVADPSGTATVFKVYYQGGNWKAQDASRTTESDKSFVIGQDFETNWTRDQYRNQNNKNHPFNAGDNDNSEYVIYDAGDNGHNRFYYLSRSLGSGSTDLNTIASLLAVAGDASPNVNIAYNTFNGSLGEQRKDFIPATTLSVDLAYSSGGGTRPDLAFNDAQGFTWTGAYKQVGNELVETDRYVVLVTDGAPQGGTAPSSGTVEDAVRTAAQNLKNNSHVKLITVGLSMENVTSGKRLLYDIADTDKDGEKMFYMAENASDLTNIFRHITKVLMEDAVVLGDITDTVGEAFYLVDKATGLPLKPGDKIDLEGNLTTDDNKATGIVQSDGRTIKWIDQSIDAVAGWHGTAYVKAKEEFLGGNAVQTNDGEATVVAKKYRVRGEDHTFDTTIVRDTLKLSTSLPSPKVNVNELTFFNNETEWTVYLGTDVDPKQQLRALYDSLVVEEVVNTDGSLHYSIASNNIEERWDAETGTAATFSLPGLIENLIRKDPSLKAQYFSGSELNWDNFLTDIMSNGITLPYHEYGLTDGGNIKITLEKTVSAGEKDDLINESPHATTVTGDEVEKYVLRIAYEPDYTVTPVGQGGQSTEDFHTGTFGSMYQGHAAGRESSTNTHVINVFAKTIEVEKLKPADNDSTERLTDKLATFSLYRKWKAGDGVSSKVSLAGYTLNGTPIGEPSSDDDYYYLIESNHTTDGIARFTEGLNAKEGPFYLAETATPEGYVENKVLQTVTVTPGPDIKKDLNGYTTTDMPFNWEQGVKFEIDGTGMTEEDGYFKTAVLNTPLTASLQLKKQVTINDFDIAHTQVEDKTEADGTYIINIDGKEGTDTEGKSYTVKITIENGVPASATVKDNSVAGSADNPVTLTGGAVEIPDMVPGEYTVTEAHDSKTVLTAINSTDDSAVEDLENRKITINLDGTAESVQLVTLINNYADNSETDIAHVSVRKTFKGLKPGMTLPEGFKVSVKVTATIDGRPHEFDYTLTGKTDTANGVIWNSSVNDDGDIVWEWKIAIHGLTPDAHLEVEELNYLKPGYDVSTSVNPNNEGSDGTSYVGQVSPSTTVQSIATVITEQNSLIFPLEDKGTEQTIFIARIVPSQTSLVISKNKLNLSEKAQLEDMLHHMPNAEDWYNDTPPMYYSFEEAANNQIIVRNSSTVTYYEENGKGYIRFSKKAQWNMVASRKLIYVEGRPADVNFENSYTENGVGLDIVKVDETQRTTTLPGAVFTLTKLDETTTPSHRVYKKTAETEDLEKQVVSDPTDDNGATSFASLTSGYYEIKETIPPAGYVLQGDECFYVKISDGVARYLAVSDDDSMPITEWEIINETDDADKIQVTIGRADDQATSDTDETVNTEFSVGNTPGAELPHTGGIGTTIFYILGSLLVIGSAIVLISRRRIRK